MNNALIFVLIYFFVFAFQGKTISIFFLIIKDRALFVKVSFVFTLAKAHDLRPLDKCPWEKMA